MKERIRCAHPVRGRRPTTALHRGRLRLIVAAADERDHRVRGLRLEKLAGSRAGQHSIRLNEQFRLILRFESDDDGRIVIVVELTDYHWEGKGPMNNVMKPAEAFSPGEYLRDELAERGWSEAEFADILDRPAQAISELLNGKKEITAETAVAIGAALGTSAELWLNLQSAYRLHGARETAVATDVERRAALRALVPVRELQQRRWLPDTKDLDVLETAVCALLDIGAISDRPTWAAAARRSSSGTEFTPEQTAWIARVRAQGAGRVNTALDLVALADLAAGLTCRLRNPADLAALGDWLAGVGVALVVEVPLKSSKIDGVVIFGADGTPIIGLSTRGDRMDSVIFTLLHEVAHLSLGHVAVGEVRLDEDLIGRTARGKEAEANAAAAGWVLPAKLELGPGKPTMPRIIAEAQRIGVHPSLVIGRLQRERILDWSDFRRTVPKARPFMRIG